jgi:prophage regulatory protein
MNNKIIRLRAAKDWTGLSRSTIYAMMKSGDFPQNILIGARAVGWLESDIRSWVDARVDASKVVV